MEFLNDITVWRALMITLIIICTDTVLGILVAISKDQFKVEVTKLPQFLRTGVLPYLGALTLLAFLERYVYEWRVMFQAVFYTSTAFVLGKYAVNIKDKIQCLFS